jgi:Carboxypeptidase regulatory-like domain
MSIRPRSLMVMVGIAAAIIGVLLYLRRGDGRKTTVLRAPKNAELDPWAGTPAVDNSPVLETLRAARSNAPLDVRAGKITGRITAKSTGAGIAGALVTIDADDLFGSSDKPPVVVESSNDGLFIADGLPPRSYSVGVTSAGFSPALRLGRG